MGIKIGFIEDALDKIEAEYGKTGKEIAKQAIDQPLHVLMAVASVWLIGWLLTLTGLSVVLSVVVAGVLTGAWMAVREYFQWPSSRWWDPVLDWLFEAGGLALGIWSFLAIFT
jgi:hypothetical protein